MLSCLILYQWMYTTITTSSVNYYQSTIRRKLCPSNHSEHGLEQAKFQIGLQRSCYAQNMTFMSDDWNRTNFWLLDAELNELIVTLFPLL